VYSLVSPPELAAALVRHPTGSAVSDVLDRALRIDRSELSRLSLAYRNDARRQSSWAGVASLAGLTVPTEGTLVGTVAGAGGSGTAGVTDTAGVSDTAGVTDTAPVVAGLVLGDLLDLLREEILGWSREQLGELVVQTDPGGATAVADALGAAWAGGDLTATARETLRMPWQTVYGSMPVVAGADEFGSHSAAVRRLLDTLATASGDTLAQLGEAYRLQAPPRPSGVRPWDVAMRRACQAAFVTGTVRQVAAAQFAAVRAQLLPGAAVGLPGTAGGDSVAYAVAGTVQAVTMQETLDPVVYRFLVFAWEATFGTRPS
jgi:hypothetical protein